MKNIQELIKNNFNKATQSYLTNATIQQNSALKLISLLNKYYNTGKILDLGSGIGTLKHNQSINNYSIYALDLSLEMLKINNSQFKVNGDAYCLPFADNSFSIIISNLMLQWAFDKKQMLSEIYRILKPGGKLILSSLITPSLYELHQAYSKINDKVQILRFSSKHEYFTLLNHFKFNLTHSDTWINTIYFPNLLALFKHFKLTGTNLPQLRINKGLGGRLQLKQLTDTYIQDPNGFPLTYSYLLIVASKEYLSS